MAQKPKKKKKIRNKKTILDGKLIYQKQNTSDIGEKKIPETIITYYKYADNNNRFFPVSSQLT